MKYETRDSGQREQFENGGQRDTEEGKPRFDLVLPKDIPYKEQMLTRWAELMARGAKKYDARNWEKFCTEKELDRAKSSLLRHAMQLVTGEEDEDHAAAVMFNVMVIEYVKYKQLEHDTIAFILESSVQEDPWTEGEHRIRGSEYTRHNPLLCSTLTRGAFLELEDIDEAHEQLSVENHPDFAWVWEE